MFLSAANLIVLIVELTHSSYLKIQSERDKHYEIEAVGKEKIAYSEVGVISAAQHFSHLNNFCVCPWHTG